MLRSLAMILALPMLAVASSASVPMVAVMPFSGRTLDADALDGIAATLATDLLNTGKFRVMERSQMATILKEQGFQQSGACDVSECAVEMGRLLSVDHMVIGTVSKVGSTYVVNARLVSVQTGEVLKSVSRTSRADVDAIVTELLPGLSQELSAQTSTVALPHDPSDSMATPATGGGTRWGWWIAGGALVVGGATAALLLANGSSGSSSSNPAQSIDLVVP